MSVLALGGVSSSNKYPFVSYNRIVWSHEVANVSKAPDQHVFEGRVSSGGMATKGSDGDTDSELGVTGTDVSQIRSVSDNAARE